MTVLPMLCILLCLYSRRLNVNCILLLSLFSNCEMCNAIVYHQIIIFCNYIFSCILGKGILFTHEELVNGCYECVNKFSLKSQTQLHDSNGIDLGYNMYDENHKLTCIDAQRVKWDFMFDKLGLQENDYVIDVGCGYGEWLNYLKSRNIHVCGVNMSIEQSKYIVKKYNIEVINEDWKSIVVSGKYSNYKSKYNAITFMDTVELYPSPFYKCHKERQNNVYNEMFSLASYFLQEDGKVFLSTIHTNDKKWSLYSYFQMYVLDHTMSGLYPTVSGNELTINAKKNGIREVVRYDKTESYRYSAIKAEQSWQFTSIFYVATSLIHTYGLIHTGLLVFDSILYDPAFLLRIVSTLCNSWMYWYGKHWNNPTFNEQLTLQNTFVNVFMILYQKN
jgi:cyclopropane fatty-acyl-phospholipid synthase-like methyltransferase